nr:MAG TPA: hypothetical protein [Bacteriophage sp.]
MLVLYYAIRVCVNSFAAYYSHKIYIIILLPHCALCALWYTLTHSNHGGMISGGDDRGRGICGGSRGRGKPQKSRKK